MKSIIIHKVIVKLFKMVKICSNTYPTENENLYKEHFEKYPFPLSPFQKHALEAIVEGHHILVTAHTGSGKTLPAEFAIEYFVAKGKKVIYTSPIKALSNQKFHEFTLNFPHIKFGILTGDIKANPEADVLIMTTEILQNTLYKKKHNAISISSTTNATNATTTASLMFDMDIETELGAVIFDEIHYINDPDRGKVWEETIMMLPLHIQMVMLSATIDSPEKFALWCETRGGNSSSDKSVYLASTHERVVPLTHYSFITATQGVFKSIGKDEDLKKQINDMINKPHVIQSAKGEFNDIHYHKMKKMISLFEQKEVRISRAHVLNQVCKYLVENNMLPAICFVLSRKQLEVCASEITFPLLEDDSKVGYIVKKECEQIIRKLPNYQEYIELPEYLQMVRLLEKGIGIHHAGIMPVLREMVELLFARGYIKILFATETFAVGINMPTKTVIFTDVNKFDGSGMRMLYSHEYSQMSGRAGRRGIDTIGSVIHLNNLFKNVELTAYRNMMKGTPQRLTSKFKISYNLLLNLIDIGDQHFLQFCKRSMIQNDIDSELGIMQTRLTELETDVENMHGSIESMRTPQNVISHYLDSLTKRITSVNKKRKELDKEIASLQDTYKYIDTDKVLYIKYTDKCKELEDERYHFNNTEQYLNDNVLVILDFLEKDGFLQKIEEIDIDKPTYVLTTKGQMATYLREIHCLVFARLLDAQKFDPLSAKQMVSVFSCFTNVSVPDDSKSHKPSTQDNAVKNIIQEITSMYDYYQDFELKERTNTGVDYEIHYDLIDYVLAWCDCESAPECKLVLQKLEQEKDVFLGEFVKAILKINNISCEMERIAESCGNMALLSKLKEIPLLTLKFVATNQSLYV